MEKVSARLEDYLEAIYEICRKNQVARVRDVAKRLGLSNASVVGALRGLRERRLIDQERYGYIKLTAAGESVAEDIVARHRALSNFFRDVLNLSRERADKEACEAEHCLGQGTIERLALLQEFLTARQGGAKFFAKRFSEFSRARKAM